MHNPSASTSDFDSPNARILLIPKQERWKFFILFTFMTILGWIVGGIASIALEKVFTDTPPPSIIIQQQTWYSIAKYLSSSVFAIIFAIDQALLLRKYVSGWLWMLATSFGWLVSNTVSAAWIDYISQVASSGNQISTSDTVIFGLLSTFCFILSGIWVGFFQWLVLRRYVMSGWWWNYVPSLSFLFISISLWLLSQTQEFIPETNRTEVLYLFQQGLTASILGIVPAIGLCSLRTKSRVRGT
jgi:hypothetical protein